MFMQGLHAVFIFASAISLVAIVCSSLRGTEYKPAAADSDVSKAVGVPAGEVRS